MSVTEQRSKINIPWPQAIVTPFLTTGEKTIEQGVLRDPPEPGVLGCGYAQSVDHWGLMGYRDWKLVLISISDPEPTY